MTVKEFYFTLFEKIKNRQDVVLKTRALKYEKGIYDFLKIVSKGIDLENKIILIRAGIHGDEIAGPITILRYVGEIIDYIHKSGLKLIIYPLGNPSGFDSGKRYNIDDDRGEVGNNDFLRYELANGKLVDDIKGSDEFKNWFWSSDPKLRIKLPMETELMLRSLKEDPLSQIVAVIDLHQDYIDSDASLPGAYHYAFGNLRVYDKIVKKIEKIVPIWKNKIIGAGQIDAMQSDKKGFIVRHDGSMTDLFSRLGVQHCITVETTGGTPLDDACRINLIWIFGITDLITNQN